MLKGRVSIVPVPAPQQGTASRNLHGSLMSKDFSSTATERGGLRGENNGAKQRAPSARQTLSARTEAPPSPPLPDPVPARLFLNEKAPT